MEQQIKTGTAAEQKRLQSPLLESLCK